ncbi:MAG: SWIM zinc finger domain-containing protein, partial [Saprospiraceae bacterium]
KIRQLHDSQLAGIFGRTILNRAYDYAEAIESVEVQPGRAEAEIYGTELYEVTLEHRAGDVFGDCSCPYDDGACKHLAALLMHLRDNGGEALEQSMPSKFWKKPCLRASNQRPSLTSGFRASQKKANCLSGASSWNRDADKAATLCDGPIGMCKKQPLPRACILQRNSCRRSRKYLKRCSKGLMWRLTPNTSKTANGSTR